MKAILKRLKKFLPYLGYPVFYLVAFVAFCSWTFPYEKIRDRIVLAWNESEQKSQGPGRELLIGDIGSSWLTGVKLKDVKLVSPPTEPGGAPAELTIESLTLRVSLLPLLVGRQTLTFSMSGLGGAAGGKYFVSGKERNVEADLENLDVGQLTPLTSALGLPMEGRLTGAVRLALPDARPEPEPGKTPPPPDPKANKGGGTVALSIRDLAVGDGKTKIKGALALPRMQVGTLDFTADGKDGAFKVTKLAAGGKDVEVQGDGKVQLRDHLAETLLDLYVRFKVNDSYRTKSDVTKSIFGAPGSTAPALLELADARVKQSKRPDGFYSWHVRGLVSKPDFEPWAAASPYAK